MSAVASGVAATAKAPEQTNPFPGLRPFREDEEYLFFGRENQVDAMVDKLAATRFLGVVGASGSGKSSLVNCGLRPALHRGLMAQVGTTWRIAQFRPGADPVRAMAGALAKDGVLLRGRRTAGPSFAEIVDTTLRMSRVGLIDVFEQARLDDDVNLLVVVDQFEELFRYRQLQAGDEDTVDGQAAVAFVNLLLEAKEQAARPIYVVLTIRADFLGECARFPGLAEAVNDGQYLVPRMTRDERRAAIAGPIGVGGATVEPVLLTRLLNDVGDNPDQLSILQHALNRTWARWQECGGEGPLRLAHYEEIGTMAHALDRHAERAYGELDAVREPELCERIFKALTDKATDPRGVRRPMHVGALCEVTGAQQGEVAAVIDVFRKPSRSFLMPPAGEALEPETVVDISHESLMRVWQRLDGWADDEAESSRAYRRLAEAAAQYGVGKASLLRDPELQFAVNWRDRNQPNEKWADRYHSGFAPAMRFLAESEAARDDEQRAARRRLLFLVGLAVVLFALLAISVALGLWAFHQKSEAVRQRRAAENASKSATLLALTASANDRAVTPLGSALLLSLAAYQSQPSFVSRRSVVLSLEDAVEEPIALILRTHAPAAALALSPDGRTLATADRLGRVRRWDLKTHRRVGPTRAVVDAGSHTTTTHPSVAFGPNGSLVEGTDARLTLWPAGGGAVSLRDPVEHIQGEVRTVAFSPDKRHETLASSGFDGQVRLWDLKSHRVLARFDGRHERLPVNGLAFSPNGRTIASGGDDGVVRLWDVRTRRLRAPPLQVRTSALLALAFGRRGTLATADRDGAIKFWDVRTRKQIGPPLKTGRAVLGLALSADGSRIAAALDDGTVTVWDAARHVLFSSASSGPTTSRTIAFERDGRLVSSSSDGDITVWGRAPSPGGALTGRVSVPAALPRTSESLILPVMATSPDGKFLAAGGAKGLRLWDARTRKPLAITGAEPAGTVTAVAFSPDGKLLAEAVGGEVRLWRAGDLPRLVSAGQARFGRAALDTLAFSRRGLLAAGDVDSRVHIWDVRRPRARPRVVGIGSDVRNAAGERFVFDVAFSPDGRTLASGGWDGTLRLWRVRDGAHATLIGAPGGMKAGASIRSLEYSPRGRVIAVGSADGTISLWDAVRRKELLESTPGTESVENVLFTPNGEVLVTAGDDGALRLWDVRTLLPLGQVSSGHVGKIRRLAVSRDASVLATAGRDGKVRLWPGIVWANKQGLIDRVCRLVAGGITSREWETVLRRVSSVAAQQPRPHLCGT